MRSRRGSLSVEAVISATVFISVMFLLLNIVKLVLFMTILNNATTETAKVIATSAYPISILNEKQAGIEKSVEAYEPGNLKESLLGTVSTGFVTQFFGGDGLKAMESGGTASIKKLIEGAAVELAKDAVYELKGKAVNALCANVVKGYVENCGIELDQERLMLRAVKIPQTDMEYKTLYTSALNLSEEGTLSAQPASSPSGSDGDFNAEDVLICLEYPYEFALPFLPSVSLTLRSTAVEHAWLHGTSAGPKRTEGINVSDILFGKDTVVYVATGGHGKRYHKENCSTLWTSNAPMSLSAAKSQGYTACKVCNPPEK